MPDWLALAGGSALEKHPRYGQGMAACSLHSGRQIAADELGDRKAACPTAGVLKRRSFPFERAAARVCREGGARVVTYVFLRDLSLDVPLSDGRQMEVVANGLPAFGSAQVAVDVTLVSPVQPNGASRPGADVEPGKALREADGRKRRTT